LIGCRARNNASAIRETSFISAVRTAGHVPAASTTTSDDATNNQTYGGTGRITWNLGKLFWDYGKQALSLRTNFNRTRDMVTHTDTNEIGVFLILDLLSPYNL